MSSGKTNISDIPTEILIKILLYLDPEERVPFGNSCKQFNSLVFEDKELLRTLDFSKNGHETSESDIEQYFNNEIACKHILRLNVRNVYCINPPPLLYIYIGRASNLVDVDIQGEAFKDIWLLASFLSPMIHLKSLAIHWGITEEDDRLCRKVLEKPFGRLTYLSVKIKINFVNKFFTSLELCQELRKLYMCVTADYYDTYNASTGRCKKLRNLEILGLTGREWSDEVMKNLITILPDPEKWTDFQMGIRDKVDLDTSNRDDLDYDGMDYDYYLEKNVEVCKELMGGEWMNRVPDARWKDLNLGWALFPELLLKSVLEVIYKVPEKLCCLSTFREERCILTIEETKVLLKNPRYQISYLYVSHDIGRGCDIHLAASAFPCLTELHLCNVTNRSESTQDESYYWPWSRRRDCAVSHRQDNSLNPDFSFKLLVQITPHVKHLTLEGSNYSWEEGLLWDKDALYVIPSWKNLESLRLLDIPICEWRFLIEIGKQCTKLQKLVLDFCRSSEFRAPNFKKALLEMLPHCHELKDFSILINHYYTDTSYIGHLSEWFICLAGNKRLKKVGVESPGEKENTAFLIQSIDNLLNSCPELTTLTCITESTTKADRDLLSSAVQRLKREFRLLDIKINVS